jgi:hypothetical protein
VIADGMTAEAMVVFTSGTFLTAMAIRLGAKQFPIGLICRPAYFYNHFSAFFYLVSSPF